MGILVWRIKRGLRSLDGVERYVELVDGEFGCLLYTSQGARRSAGCGYRRAGRFAGCQEPASRSGRNRCAGDCENPKRSHGSGRHSGADALGRGRDVRSLIDIGNPGIANYRKERNCEKHSRQVRDRRASAGRCGRAGRLARVRRQDIGGAFR